MAGVANVHLDATEYADRIVFLHAVRPGPASRSYGLQVAALAGVPQAGDRARRGASCRNWSRPTRWLAAGDAPAERHPPQGQLLFDATRSRDALLERLRALDPDALSPRAGARTLLYELRRLTARRNLLKIHCEYAPV